MSFASCNKEGKREFEKYLDELGEAVPKFCPDCGDKLIWISNEGKIWIMPVGNAQDNTSLKITGFDIYCDSCEWSGNINPDFDIPLLQKED